MTSGPSDGYFVLSSRSVCGVVEAQVIVVIVWQQQQQKYNGSDYFSGRSHGRVIQKCTRDGRLLSRMGQITSPSQPRTDNIRTARSSARDRHWVRTAAAPIFFDSKELTN